MVFDVVVEFLNDCVLQWPDCTESLKNRVCCIIKQPKRDITYAWVISLVCIVLWKEFFSYCKFERRFWFL